MIRILHDMLGLRPARLQVAALCLREGDAGREVLLVTSRGRGRWILPKGWPMAGRDLAGAALQEAWEEAGVEGRVSPTPVGGYRHLRRGDGGLEEEIDMQVFVVEGVRLLDDYPEVGQRERGWFPLTQAVAEVDEPALADFLRTMASTG